MARAKIKNENNEWIELNLPPGGDTLPIGSIIEFIGDTIPYGYELYEDGTPKKIKKVKNAIGLVGKVVTNIASQKEDEVLDVKTIIDYVNKKFKTGQNGLSCDISNQDLNSVVDTGFYYGNNVTNNPENKAYLYLISICHHELKTYSTQIAIESGNADLTNIYIRKQFNGVWTKWNKITTTVIS